jgi:hypothetical protein
MKPRTEKGTMFEIRVLCEDALIETLTASSLDEAEAVADRWAELEGYVCVIEDLGDLEGEAPLPDAAGDETYPHEVAEEHPHPHETA